MYLLINPDNTVNFADDHPINEGLDVDGLRLIEFKDQSLDEVVGNIQPEMAVWDENTQTVVVDPVIASFDQEIAHRRLAANKKITQHYPIWKQLNILREGNTEQIAAMGNFIDACRDWSNHVDATLDQLESISP